MFKVITSSQNIFDKLSGKLPVEFSENFGSVIVYEKEPPLKPSNALERFFSSLMTYDVLKEFDDCLTRKDYDGALEVFIKFYADVLTIDDITILPDVDENDKIMFFDNPSRVIACLIKRGANLKIEECDGCIKVIVGKDTLE